MWLIEQLEYTVACDVGRTGRRTCRLVLCILLAFMFWICSELDTYSASSASHPQSWRGVSAWHIKPFEAVPLFDLLRDIHHFVGIL